MYKNYEKPVCSDKFKRKETTTAAAWNLSKYMRHDPNKYLLSYDTILFPIMKIAIQTFTDNKIGKMSFLLSTIK